MRRALLLVILLALPAFGQAQRYDGTVLDGQGHPIAGAQVLVCDESTPPPTVIPCSSPATLYTSQTAGTQGPNPVFTDGLGNYHFYVAASTLGYQMQISAPSISGTQIYDNILAGVAAGAGGPANAIQVNNGAGGLTGSSGFTFNVAGPSPTVSIGSGVGFDTSAATFFKVPGLAGVSAPAQTIEYDTTWNNYVGYVPGLGFGVAFPVMFQATPGSVNAIAGEAPCFKNDSSSGAVDDATEMVPCGLAVDLTKFGSSRTVTLTAPASLSANHAINMPNADVILTQPQSPVTGQCFSGLDSTTGAFSTTPCATGITGGSPSVQYLSAASYTVPNTDNTWRDVFTAASTAVTLPKPSTVSSSPYVAQRYFTSATCSPTCTTTSFTQAANDTLIVWVDRQSTVTITSVTDTAGDTATKVYDLNSGDAFNDTVTIYRFDNIVSSGSNTVSVTGSGSFSALAFGVFEYQGLTPDNHTSGTSASGPPVFVSVPVSYQNELAIAADYGQGLGGCPAGWTQRQAIGNGPFCDRLINSSGAAFYTSLNTEGAVILQDFGSTSTLTYTAGWYVVLVNNSATGNATVTSTSSTINGAATLVIPPKAWCSVMSDGVNYEANCGPLTPPVPSVQFTTTAVTSESVSILGMTSSGHCSLAAQNASAATNIATTYISAYATGGITLTHTATAGMIYDFLCTSN